MAAVALAGVATLGARIALLGLARFAGLVALLGLARLALGIAGLAWLAALLLRHRDAAVDRVARIATRKRLAALLGRLAALLGRLAALLGRLAALLRLGLAAGFATVIMTVGFYDIVFAMGHLYIVLSYRKSWRRVVDLSPEIKEKLNALKCSNYELSASITPFRICALRSLSPDPLAESIKTVFAICEVPIFYE